MRRSVIMGCMLAALVACGSEGESDDAGASDGTGAGESIALEGTNWALTELTVLGGYVFTPDDSGKYRLNFRSGNRLTGTSDCNTLGGTWAQSPEQQSLVFEQLDSTRAMCIPGSLHNNFLLYLRQVSHYTIENGNMVLTTPTEGIRISLKPSP